ncbi:hypothetical protein [Nocardiopsis oceani]
MGIKENGRVSRVTATLGVTAAALLGGAVLAAPASAAVVNSWQSAELEWQSADAEWQTSRDIEWG